MNRTVTVFNAKNAKHNGQTGIVQSVTAGAFTVKLANGEVVTLAPHMFVWSR